MGSWRCVGTACEGSRLRVAELPRGPLAPLLLDCERCATRMVVCECCHALLAADREVDGVLLCTRCGFLTVLDASLRARVQIPPFSRGVLLTRVSLSPVELDRLKHQWQDWEKRALLAQQRTSSEGNGSPSLSAAHKKRRRPGEDAGATLSPQSEPAQLSTTSPRRSTMPPELKAEGKQLQAEIQRVKRQWQSLLDEANAESAAQGLQSLQQQLFSSTHLHILKIMYDKAMETAELNGLGAQIEQFLLQQSTIVKNKYDLLAAIRSYQQAAELPSIVPPCEDSDVPVQAVDLLIRCVKERVRHLQSQFNATACQYLRLVGVANKHLFALYNAAQNLSRMQSKDGEDAAQRQRGMLSPCHGLLVESSRKRRLFGSGGSSMSGEQDANDNSISISRVQQDIEMGHRISEIAKKIELWRSLSYTIGSCCVVRLSELADSEKIRF